MKNANEPKFIWTSMVHKASGGNGLSKSDPFSYIIMPTPGALLRSVLLPRARARADESCCLQRARTAQQHRWGNHSAFAHICPRTP